MIVKSSELESPLVVSPDGAKRRCLGLSGEGGLLTACEGGKEV